jgi:hypothetical protein
MKAKEIKRAKKRFAKETTKNFTSGERESPKMMELLRRVYDLVEENHLKFNKFGPRTFDISFSSDLTKDIFNYLQVKDQKFRDTTIRRQKNFRKRWKNEWKKTYDKKDEGK